MSCAFFCCAIPFPSTHQHSQRTLLNFSDDGRRDTRITRHHSQRCESLLPVQLHRPTLALHGCAPSHHPLVIKTFAKNALSPFSMPFYAFAPATPRSFCYSLTFFLPQIPDLLPCSLSTTSCDLALCCLSCLSAWFVFFPLSKAPTFKT